MKNRKSNSFFVRYITRDGEERLVVLPNFTKLALWFLREARHCTAIVIGIFMD